MLEKKKFQFKKNKDKKYCKKERKKHGNILEKAQEKKKKGNYTRKQPLYFI